jgi:phytoene dehydrogenase-like protein
LIDIHIVCISGYPCPGEKLTRMEIIGRQYARQCIQTWERFAPNLSSDKAVLDWVPYTPLEISQKMINMVQGDWMCGAIKLDNMLDQRPLPELGGYKTPIGRLYMAGSTQHPHGFITFGPAYNALSVIADDLGIKPWWRRI